ncbi:MAG: glycosyltransferase [Clostridia bacterium]|nr:glycosyltransferase [Clostridia bacterium]MBP5269524.1 glycosyltransferase [Clostridia bacterium]
MNGSGVERGIRVCLANDSFPPLIDGVANTVVNYAAVIEKQFGSAIVATPGYPGVTDDYPFPVVRYRSLNTTRLLGYRSGDPFDPDTFSKISSFSPDVIHSHCPLASSFLCRGLREETGAPLVFTYHTKFDIDFERALKLGFLKEAAVRVMIENISASDEVWAVNRGAADNLRSLGYGGEIRIMPNGVDFPEGRLSGEDTAALRAELGLSRDVPVFLFVGRMMWYKGQRIILEGLRRLVSSGRDFRMLFVGDGDDLAEIKKAAEDCGVGDRCRFTGAVRDRGKLRELYSISDLFILPSVFDNNPIVVKEAAACAVASVLIRGSSSAEGATDGVDSLLIGEDGEELAAVLERSVYENDLTRRLGEAALRDLYVSWDDMIASAVSRYREIIAAHRSGELPERKRRLSDIAIETLADISSAVGQMRDSLPQWIR